ncbi:MAG: hypothetical protein IRZ13_18870, partial [Acetobacteraceae bacterium]|nr:hypothetical protein [Acetobacteraceae bacterium]
MARDADELKRLLDEWFDREVERQWRLFASGDFARALYSAESNEDERHKLNRRWPAADAERTIEALAADYTRGRFGSPRSEARGEIEEARIRWTEGAIEHRPTRPGRASAAIALPTPRPAKQPPLHHGAAPAPASRPAPAATRESLTTSHRSLSPAFPPRPRASQIEPTKNDEATLCQGPGLGGR